MGKIFKFLFIYILFFNVMFGAITESMAASFKDNLVGPRDRVRSFVNGEIDFRYNRNTGFSCRPAGLKSYPNRDEFKNINEDALNVRISDAIANMLLNTGQDIASYLESILFDVIFQPIFCITFLQGLMESGSFAGKDDEDDNSGKDTTGTKSLLGNMVGVLKIILSLVGVNSIAYLVELILGEDDYNIDPTNPYCMGFYVTEMVICLVALLVWKLNIKFTTKIIIILGINSAYYIAKMVASAVIFSRAQNAFNQLSLCGDDWNVYGDLELQEKLEEEIEMGKIGIKNETRWILDIISDPNLRSVSEKQFEIEAKNSKQIGLSYIKKYYPSKGAYFGSRQYLLDECFLSRNKEICRKLFGLNNDVEITNNTIDNFSSVIQKPYREFKYGGVEFAFNSNNGDCVDPRPERRNYLGTPDTNSQLYYFRGSEPANFACDRFLVKNTDEYKKAYRCCLEANQKLICIVNKEFNSEGQEVRLHTMCNKNSKCSIKSNIKYNQGQENKSFSCEDIKKSFANAGLGDEATEAYYNEYCDENGNLKPVYGYEYKSYESVDVKDDGKGSTVAGASRIEFKIRQSMYDENKWCVETYNLCPYNFKLMGGTEEFGDEFKQTHEENVPVEKKDGKIQQKTLSKKIRKENENRNCVFTKDGVKDCYGACRSTIIGAKGKEENVYDACYNRASNFCQMDRHCVTLVPLFEREKPDTSPYVDEACINLVGSSHNYDNYEILTDRARNSFFLSAPVVECVVETAKNVLMNKAGHTKCKDSTEEPVDGKCSKTGEIYEKGKTLDEERYAAPFHKLRKHFLGITKALMLLAVVLYGYGFLVEQKGFSSTEEVMKFIMKLMVVTYFSTNTGWISPVFNSVYAVYGEVAELAVNLIGEDADYDNPKYSGCHFVKSKYIANNYSEYGDRSYISVFDTLDCKLSRYFGFYVNAASNPPILSMILAGVFTFGFAIIFILPLLLLFVALLYFTASVALSFMVSSFTITLLLLVTPIMIPQLLFDRTKDNVMKWLKAIARNIFSPLFLIMGMFMFFTIFDKYYVGDAVFTGKSEPIRNVYCGIICKMSDEQFTYIDASKLTRHINLDTFKYTYSGEEAVNCINNLRGKVVDLGHESLLCIIQKSTKTSANTGIGIINFIVNDFKGFPGLFMQAGGFFGCFLDIVFLLIIIFIFNKFIPYIDSLTNTIFGGEGGEVDDKLTMSLREVMSNVGRAGAKFANKTKDYGGKMLANKVMNRIDEWRERRIGDPKGNPTPDNSEKKKIGLNSERDDNDKNEDSKNDSENKKSIEGKND